jgi:MYXO-CTERM domain-containing protein
MPSVTPSGNVAMRGAAAPALTAIGPLLEEDIPSIQVTAGATEAALPLDPGPPGATSPEPEPEAEHDTPPPMTPVPVETGGGCASCSAADPPSAFVAVAMLFFLLRRRR